jgi:hypothetical protein
MSGMLPLELDFCGRGASSPWMRRVLVGVAVVMAAHVGSSYVRLSERISEGEAQLARAGRVGEAGRFAGAPNASPEELRVAHETLERLTLSWQNLFGALEASLGNDVALLSIEPDARNGSAVIGAEAKDYESALGYVEKLSTSKTLRNVRLVRHEIREGESRRPLAFTVSANWKDSR